MDRARHWGRRQVSNRERACRFLTTLMEYIANRLGLIFMKINCPALGHNVLSLDPQEAPNATSAQEDVTPLPIYLLVLRGFERLLLAETDVLGKPERDQLVKLSMDRLVWLRCICIMIFPI